MPGQSYLNPYFKTLKAGSTFSFEDTLTGEIFTGLVDSDSSPWYIMVECDQTCEWIRFKRRSGVCENNRYRVLVPVENLGRTFIGA